jgi:hypothetical protein
MIIHDGKLYDKHYSSSAQFIAYDNVILFFFEKRLMTMLYKINNPKYCKEYHKKG